MLAAFWLRFNFVYIFFYLASFYNDSFKWAVIRPLVWVENLKRGTRRRFNRFLMMMIEASAAPRWKSWKKKASSHCYWLGTTPRFPLTHSCACACACASHWVARAQKLARKLQHVIHTLLWIFISSFSLFNVSSFPWMMKSFSSSCFLYFFDWLMVAGRGLLVHDICTLLLRWWFDRGLWEN